MNYLFKKIKSLKVYLRAAKQLPLRDAILTRPIYIFNHIPKCGGTSLLNILSQWFVVERDYPPHDITFPDKDELHLRLSHYKKIRKNYTIYKPWRMVSGHYHMIGFRLSDRYPEIYTNPRVKLITFLRDPLQQRISSYYYGIKRDHNYVKGLTLKDYIFSWNNYYATALECDDTNYKEVMNRYFFIGIVEKFDDSINSLSLKLKRTLMGDVPKLNISPRDSQQELSSEDILAFRNNNALDYRIFNYALTQLNCNATK